MSFTAIYIYIGNNNFLTDLSGEKLALMVSFKDRVIIGNAGHSHDAAITTPSTEILGKVN